MPTASNRRCWALFAACLALAGCADSGGLTHHYVIDASDQKRPIRAASAQNGPIIAVAPVTLPDYLNQNGIVTREPGNEVVRSEFHLWAGPLAEEIARAVAENLSIMLAMDRVTLGTATRSIPVDYTVGIEIMRFERGSDNVVQLNALWTLFRGDEKALLTMRRSQFQEVAVGQDYGAVVAAMSKAVAKLSEEVAMAISRSRPVRPDRGTAERRSRSSGRDPSGSAASRE